MANRIDNKRMPYLWGGGHNSSFSGPYDCSGAVSAVLHAAGLLNRPMVSGEFARWGAPGRGAVTIYANAGHVYMSILGRYFGTTSMNPGGGAGWFPGAPRAGFAVVHVPFSQFKFKGTLKTRIQKKTATVTSSDSVRDHDSVTTASASGPLNQPATTPPPSGSGTAAPSGSSTTATTVDRGTTPTQSTVTSTQPAPSAAPAQPVQQVQQVQQAPQGAQVPNAPVAPQGQSVTSTGGGSGNGTPNPAPAAQAPPAPKPPAPSTQAPAQAPQAPKPAAPAPRPQPQAQPQQGPRPQLPAQAAPQAVQHAAPQAGQGAANKPPTAPQGQGQGSAPNSAAK
jgi:hypothetical protein